jgi:hypothetical protein
LNKRKSRNKKGRKGQRGSQPGVFLPFKGQMFEQMAFSLSLLLNIESCIPFIFLPSSNKYS